MYNRDRDREEYERWQRYGRERGWLEKSRDEIASWFGDEEAERRRRMDRLEQDRERSSERYGDRHSERFGPQESMYGHERFGTWPESSQNLQYRRDMEYGNRMPMQDRYSDRSPSRHFEDHEARPYEGNWGPTRGRESEFTTSGGSHLAPWATQQSSLRELRGRRGPRNYKRSDERISDDIHEKIDRHLDVDAREVIIEVKDGEVTIKGTVFSRADKRLVEEMAEDVFGVKNVQNMLRVNREEGIPGENLGTSTGNSATAGNRLTGKN
ncbi:MAG: BON domain-containing protein [Candidatus Obscuribacterales bacterium]|jgi:osmotically-inducible protein OsmY|nr:BON domain-containing protein [Candidatus Obscuribacterales bacterium]